MSVKVEIPEDYRAGKDNFIINVSPNFPPIGEIKNWSLFVKWDERWIYRCDHNGAVDKFFPVDAIPGLTEWLVYCDPELKREAA